MTGDARWLPACKLDDTLTRPILPLWIGGRHLVVVRDGNDLFASDRACPHEQADLAKGHCSAGKLFCPRHFAWFGLVDGLVCGGWASPPLRVHPVRIEVGQVLVALLFDP